MKLYSRLVILSSVVVSCNSEPKVIPVTDDSATSGKSTGVFSDGDMPSQNPSGADASSGVHTVKVKEVLPTSKYVYLLVEENGSEFWISTLKVEVNVGETYFYRDGLLKTNFHSTEHNRTFEKLYLVSQIVKADHAGTAGGMGEGTPSGESPEISTAPKDVVVKGSVRVAELVANPKKYDGKEIQISGVIVKINPNIMNRNWLHIKDGSKDSYDMVVTTDQGIPEGHTVTLKGKVSLNKDFGAGYKYEIIVEDAQLVN